MTLFYRRENRYHKEYQGCKGQRGEQCEKNLKGRVDEEEEKVL